MPLSTGTSRAKSSFEYLRPSSVPPHKPCRLDIQGLRAIAVCAVILNHFNQNILPGGHLGVDIFFVISGYVITGSLFRSSRDGFWTYLAQFYARRLSRLFPALIACVLTTALVLVAIEPRPNGFLKVGIGAIFGVSNLVLWRQRSDYFSDSIEANPFMHTWSLGVEEQFYLIFPALFFFLLAVARIRPLLIVLLVLIFASFGAYALAAPQHPSAAFFLTPFRFWQLCAGCALFLFETRFGRATQSPTAAFAALALLVGSLFVPRSLGSLPVVAATGATAAYMAASSGAARRMVSFPAAVFIGNISYSLYLWHWPVISIGQRLVGISFFTAPVLIAVMLSLSLFSYYCIEVPLRKRGRLTTPTLTIASAIGCAGVCVVTLVLLAWPLNGKLYTGTRAQLVAAGVSTLTERYEVPGGKGANWRPERCVLTSNSEVGKIITADACTIAEPGADGPRILVLGNSFSAAFAGLFDTLVRSYSYRITLTSSWGAPPVASYRPYEGMWGQANQYYWEVVAPALLDGLSEGDKVVLISDLADLSPAKPGPTDHVRDFEKALLRLAERLSARGIDLAIVYGTGFVRDAKCGPQEALPQWFMPFGPNCKFYSRSYTDQRRKKLSDELTKLENRGVLTVVDLINIFCPGETCTYTNQDGVVLYRDQFSHPSVEAARLASTLFADVMTGRTELGTRRMVPVGHHPRDTR